MDQFQPQGGGECAHRLIFRRRIQNSKFKIQNWVWLAGTLVAHPGWEEVRLDLPGIGKPGLAVIELLAPVARTPGGEARLLGVAVD